MLIGIINKNNISNGRLQYSKADNIYKCFLLGQGEIYPFCKLYKFFDELEYLSIETQLKKNK